MDVTPCLFLGETHRAPWKPHPAPRCHPPIEHAFQPPRSRCASHGAAVRATRRADDQSSRKLSSSSACRSLGGRELAIG